MTDSSNDPLVDHPGDTHQNYVSGSVLIVGVGAVGGRLAWHLANLGISLRLIDKCALGPTNLKWHKASPADLGRPKADILADNIRKYRSEIDVTGLAADFIRLDNDTRDDLLDWADVVVAATDDPRVQSFLNRVCYRTAAPAVFPGVWVDARGDSEAGEILWRDPRRGDMPCYDCLTMGRHLPGDAQPGEGGAINVEALIRRLTTAVRELLNPFTLSRAFLDQELSHILIRGDEPVRPTLIRDFPNGEQVVHRRVPSLSRQCSTCGQGASAPPPFNH